MSSDPMLSEASAGALREHRTPAAESCPCPGEVPLLYARVVSLCRLVGEERFFRAAFSRVRAERAGDCEIRMSRPDAAGYETWVLELDVEEVLRDALGGDTPREWRPPAGPV